MIKVNIKIVQQLKNKNSEVDRTLSLLDRIMASANEAEAATTRNVYVYIYVKRIAALKQAKGEAWWVWTLDTEFGGMNECASRRFST